MWKDLRWYERRGGNNPVILRRFVETWVKLLAPFIPFVTEELWEQLGKRQYISLEKWPEADENSISLEDEMREEQIAMLLDDIKNIANLLKISKPHRVVIYLPSKWKYSLAAMIGTLLKEGLKPSEVFSRVMRKNEFRSVGRRAAEFTKKYLKMYWELKEEAKAALEDAEKIDFQTATALASILSRDMNVKVQIYSEDDVGIYDPNKRAGRAMPFKPAIYIE